MLLVLPYLLLFPLSQPPASSCKLKPLPFPHQLPLSCHITPSAPAPLLHTFLPCPTRSCFPAAQFPHTPQPLLMLPSPRFSYHATGTPPFPPDPKFSSSHPPLTSSCPLPLLPLPLLLPIHSLPLLPQIIHPLTKRLSTAYSFSSPTISVRATKSIKSGTLVLLRAYVRRCMASTQTALDSALLPTLCAQQQRAWWAYAQRTCKTEPIRIS